MILRPIGSFGHIPTHQVRLSKQCTALPQFSYNWKDEMCVIFFPKTLMRHHTLNIFFM